MQNMAAKGAYILLYGLMITTPVADWFMLSAFSKPVPFFGLDLLALIGVDKR
jgi:cytochrome b561